MNTHHEFSPSRLDRIENCPWSYKNCIGWNSESGKDAERGTLLHRAVYDDAAYAELSAKDREIIDSVRAEHITPYKGMERYSELFVRVFDEDGAPLTEGTLDDLTISNDGSAASLKDMKFGNYEVDEALENNQIEAYACGIFQKFPKVNTVYAMIVQPVYGVADYDAQCGFKREELPRMLAHIRDIISRAKNATESDAIPSAENCRYCNKENCKAFQRKMVANFDLMAVDPEQLSVSERELTVDFADRLLCAEKEIKAIMKSKTEAAKRLILQANGSANFRVQRGRTTRRTDWDEIARLHGIPEDEITAHTTEKEGEPFLMPRMRKPKATNSLEG